MLWSLKYLANSNSLLFDTPVKSLHISSLIHFISSKNTSVKSMTFFIVSVITNAPDVSTAEDIPSDYNFAKNSTKNGA